MRSHQVILRQLAEQSLDPTKAYVSVNGKLAPKDSAVQASVELPVVAEAIEVPVATVEAVVTEVPAVEAEVVEAQVVEAPSVAEDTSAKKAKAPKGKK